jgi:hypothetical protein
MLRNLPKIFVATLFIITAHSGVFAACDGWKTFNGTKEFAGLVAGGFEEYDGWLYDADQTKLENVADQIAELNLGELNIPGSDSFVTLAPKEDLEDGKCRYALSTPLGDVLSITVIRKADDGSAPSEHKPVADDSNGKNAIVGFFGSLFNRGRDALDKGIIEEGKEAIDAAKGIFDEIKENDVMGALQEQDFGKVLEGLKAVLPDVPGMLDEFMDLLRILSGGQSNDPEDQIAADDEVEGVAPGDEEAAVEEEVAEDDSKAEAEEPADENSAEDEGDNSEGTVVDLTASVSNLGVS